MRSTLLLAAATHCFRTHRFCASIHCVRANEQVATLVSRLIGHATSMLDVESGRMIDSP
jgi:hypothetical protein